MADAELLEALGDILDAEKLDKSIFRLSQMRDVESLGPLLWYSYGSVSTLLRIVVGSYDLVYAQPRARAPGRACGTQQASTRLCNTLSLLQVMAGHPVTRRLFCDAQIPVFLYPYLGCTNRNKYFELIRLTALGVVGALVRNDEGSVIMYLLQTEIMPLCLRIMEHGTDLSKTIAIYIVQKILLDAYGLNYVCETADRFYCISTTLNIMTENLKDQRLTKHIIRCYRRLADNVRAREALKQCLPKALSRPQLQTEFAQDPSTLKWLNQLLNNIYEDHP